MFRRTFNQGPPVPHLAGSNYDVLFLTLCCQSLNLWRHSNGLLVSRPKLDQPGSLLQITIKTVFHIVIEEADDEI